MELRNNNRQIIKDLAQTNGKENKIRSRILIITIAIAFIIILLTLSMLNASYDAYYVGDIRFMGETSSLRLSHPTTEQEQVINDLPYVDDTFMEYDLGFGKIDGIENVRCLYMTEEGFHLQYDLPYTDIKGTYPQRESEIMLSRRTLNELGITKPALGMPVEIELNNQSEFVLSGYFTDYTTEIPNSFFSKKYLDSNSDKYTVDSNLVIFDTLKSDPEISSKKIGDAAHIDEHKQTIIGDGNYQIYIYSGDNSYIIYLTLILMILLSSHFLINSSLAVTLSKDIESFALLKTLGATDSQLVKIVLYQTMRVSVFGIIIGMVIGSILVLALVPFLTESIHIPSEGAYPIFRAYKPVYIVATAILVFLMATISSFTGLRKISTLSALDSKRKAQNPDMKKRTMLLPNVGIFSKLGIARWIKARSNYMSIAMPLLLCIFVILCFTTWISGIYGTLNASEAIEASDEPDFSIYSENIALDQEDPIVAFMDKDMEEQLINMRGVTKYDATYGEYVRMDLDDEAWQPFYKRYKKTIDRDNMSDDWIFKSAVQVLTGDEINKIEKYVSDKGLNINMEVFKKGKGVISINKGNLKGKLKNEGNRVSGSSINISTKDNSITREYIFLGYINKYAKGLPELGIMATYGMPTIIVSEQGLKRLGIQKQVQQLDLYVEKLLEPRIERQLTSMLDEKNLDISMILGDAPDERGYYIGFYSTSNIKTIWNKMDRGMRVIVWGVTLSLLILTILQYSSVLITNSISRHKEFMMLNALGMTKRQILSMLMREGLFFGISTSLLLITVGSVFIWIFGQVGMVYRSYFTFEFPLKEILIAATILILLSVLLPIIVFRFGNIGRKKI